MEFLAKFFVTCHLEQGISGDFSGRYQWIYLMLGLFRNKKYILDKITQRNASKFSILVLYFNKKLRYLEKRFQTCHIFGHFIKHKHLISEECALCIKMRLFLIYLKLVHGPLQKIQSILFVKLACSRWKGNIITFSIQY